MVANAKKDELSLTPMLNAYPDSLGGTLSDIADLLESSCKDAFGAFYILPSVFNTDPAPTNANTTSLPSAVFVPGLNRSTTSINFSRS